MTKNDLMKTVSDRCSGMSVCEEKSLLAAAAAAGGIFVGSILPKRWKKAMLAVSIVAAIAACIPLVIKLIRSIKEA